MMSVGLCMDSAFLTHGGLSFKAPPYDRGSWKLLHDNTISLVSQVNEDWVMGDQEADGQDQVMAEAYREYAKVIGRDHGNSFVEPYMIDDDDVSMVEDVVTCYVVTAIRRVTASGQAGPAGDARPCIL